MKITFWTLIILLLNSYCSVAQWQQMPGPYGGYIDVLKSDSNNIYAAMWGGIYKSQDAGNTWLKKSYHPTTVFAMSGDILLSGASVAFEDSNIYCSVDGGDNWRRADSTLPSSYVSSLAIFGSNLLAGLWRKGIYLSSDTGRTWILKGLDFDRVTDISIVGNKIYASTYENGLYISSNAGNTWINVGGVLPGGNDPYPINVFLQSTGLTFLSSHDFAGGNYISLSADSGASWNYPGVIPNRLICCLAYLNGKLFAGTNEGLYFSLDSGMSWIEGSLTNIFINSLTLSGTDLFAGTKSGGVFRSQDTGNTWLAINNGISNMGINRLICSDNQVYAGTDNGLYFSNDSGNNWNLRNGGMLNFSLTSIAIVDTNILVGKDNFYSRTGGIYKSTNQGINWDSTGTGQYPILAVFVKDSIYLAGTTYGYCSSSGILKSVDSGNTWIRDTTVVDQGYISAFASIGSKLIAAGECDIFISNNYGYSWSSIYNNLPTTGYLDAKSLLVKDSVIYLLTGSHIFSSNDTGQTWNNINLSSCACRYLNDFKIAGNYMFVCGGNGICFSADYGLTWTDANQGVEHLRLSPNLTFQAIAQDSTYLYAGIAYHSLFRRPLIDFGMLTSSGEPSTKVLNIYPNPVRDEFTISDSFKINYLEIYNEIGVVVYRRNQPFDLRTINIENLSPGIYFLKLVSENNSFSRKIIKY